MSDKRIDILLLDEEPSGLVQCNVSNWEGRAYRFSRRDLSRMRKQDEFSGTKKVPGVYILLGDSENETDRIPAYIGESENLVQRFNTHNSDEGKVYWKTTIIFFSMTNRISKSHVMLLEKRLLDIAKAANRYDIKNDVAPEPHTTNQIQLEVEEFVPNVKLIVKTLGYKIFEPLNGQYDVLKMSTIQSMPDDNPCFHIARNNINATGRPTPEGFVVLKGSPVSKIETPSIPECIHKIRQRLTEDGILAEKGELLEFVEDYLFKSCSSAASVVIGGSANGNNEWKLDDGTTLKNYENKPDNDNVM